MWTKWEFKVYIINGRSSDTGQSNRTEISFEKVDIIMHIGIDKQFNHILFMYCIISLLYVCKKIVINRLWNQWDKQSYQHTFSIFFFTNIIRITYKTTFIPYFMYNLGIRCSNMYNWWHSCFFLYTNSQKVCTISNCWYKAIKMDDFDKCIIQQLYDLVFSYWIFGDFWNKSIIHIYNQANIYG